MTSENSKENQHFINNKNVKFCLGVTILSNADGCNNSR